MKELVTIIFLTLLVGARVAADIDLTKCDPQKSDTARIAGWEWIDEAQDTGAIERGDHPTCGVEYGATIEVVSRHGDALLVEYTPPYGSSTAGTPCDRGVRFIVSVDWFCACDAKYKAAKKEIDEKLILIKLLQDSEN